MNDRQEELLEVVIRELQETKSGKIQWEAEFVEDLIAQRDEIKRLRSIVARQEDAVMVYKLTSPPRDELKGTE